MQIVREIEVLKSYLKDKKNSGKSVGFVPTMGALHNGHAELVKYSKNECDITVCSIFVNPTQFNNQEDLDKYPRMETEDFHFLDVLGCDVVFIPSVDEMYNSNCTLKFSFGNLETTMEGAFRPGHFNGVALIVSKLFNVVQPDRAYFGQKDLQQLAVIRRLVSDLSFQLDIVGVPTVREESGLAMSSRNKRLSEKALLRASQINKSLESIEDEILKGVSFDKLKSIQLRNLSNYNIQVEYLELVDSDTLEKIENKNGNNSVAVCIAAIVDGVRLIDNRIF